MAGQNSKATHSGDEGAGSGLGVEDSAGFQEVEASTSARTRSLFEALWQSQSHLAEAQRIAHLGNWVWDIESNTVIWSDQTYNILGLRSLQTKAAFRSFLTSVHPDDRSFITRSLKEALSGAKPYRIDHRIVRPDGTVRIIHQDGEVTFDNGHRPIRMAGTVHDITELKTVETELRALSHRLVEVQEEERGRIARELHDQIGQSLTYLKLMVDNVLCLVNKDVRDAVSEVSVVINELIGRIRNLSLDLWPSMLDDLGLFETLVWYFERYTAQTQLQIDFRHSGLDRSLSRQSSIGAYRIIQEALTNVVRHAGVGKVQVYVWADDIELGIAVEDEGAGFDLGKSSPAACVGLRGMQERAFLLGGELTIESSLGSGTQIVAKLPLQPVHERKGGKEDNYDKHRTCR